MNMNSTFWVMMVLASAAHPGFAAQTETKEVPSAKAPAPSLDAVRRAYADGRDKDVLVMAERALIEASTAGDIEMKAAELYFWKGSALRRLGRLDEALIAFEHSKTLGFAGPDPASFVCF